MSTKHVYPPSTKHVFLFHLGSGKIRTRDQAGSRPEPASVTVYSLARCQPLAAANATLAADSAAADAHGAAAAVAAATTGTAAATTGTAAATTGNAAAAAVAAPTTGTAATTTGVAAMDVVIDIDSLHSGPVKEQVLALFKANSPKAGKTKWLDQWSGTSKTGVFKGSVLVHVLVRASNGRLMGIAKGFKMALGDELFIDEVLVASEDRGQRLLQLMVLALIEACGGKAIKRVRLQCVESKLVNGQPFSLRDKVYVPMGLTNNWVEKKTGPWAGVGPSRGDVMVWGTGAAVRKACAALVGARGLPCGANLSIHEGGYDPQQDPLVQELAARAANATGATTPMTDERTDDGAADEENVDERIHAEQQEIVAPDDGSISKSWGAKLLRNALAVLLVPIMFSVNDLTPESPYSKVGINITADAATLRNAPKSQRTVSTVLLRALSWGVEKGRWGANAIQYMIPGAMSARAAFKLRL